MIAGGGLAGCLAALALAPAAPRSPACCCSSRATSFGGNHVWSFFDADVAEADRWLVEPIIAKSWPGYDIRFPRRRRTLPPAITASAPSCSTPLVRERLRPDQYRLGAAIASVDRDGVTLEGGERIEAGDRRRCARRRPGSTRSTSAGRSSSAATIVLAAPHGLDRPIVMDACVDQSDGYRFVYCLPFAEDRLLIEDTYYSTDPALDRDALGRRIDDYAAAKGWRVAALEREETGVLPVAMGGDFDAFWPAAETVSPDRRCAAASSIRPPAIRCPTRCGRRSCSPRQADFASLHQVLRAEAARLWRRRGFYRLLDRMLFRAAGRRSATACSSISTGSTRADRALLCRPLDRCRPDADPQRAAAGAARHGR